MRGRRALTIERPKVIPSPPLLTNSLWHTGRASTGNAGLGFGTPTNFYYPMCTPFATKITKIGIGGGQFFTKDDDTLWTYGSNQYGNQGRGTSGKEYYTLPVEIKGGVPLYYEEEQHEHKIPTIQKESPLKSPILANLPKIVELTSGLSFRGVRLLDGTCLMWGGNAYGALSNGWQQYLSEAAPKLWAEGNWRPQHAPYWALTGPGPGESENPSGNGEIWPDMRNVLGHPNNIHGASSPCAQLCAGHFAAAFLLENGEIWISGQGRAFVEQSKEYAYAVKSPIWETKRATFAAEGKKATKIALSYLFALVKMSDNTIRVSGTLDEGFWGVGKDSESFSTKERIVIEPERVKVGGGFEPLTDVIEIETGEYNLKARKGDGTIWTWGSNREGQQGLGLPMGGQAPPVTRPTEIPGLEAVEMTCGGELRGSGQHGGDTVFMRQAGTGTVKAFGAQWNNYVNPKVPRGEETCALGLGEIKIPIFNVDSPITIPRLTNITAMIAGPAAGGFLKEGTAPTSNLSVKFLPAAKKKFKVEWETETETPFPIWTEHINEWIINWNRPEDGTAGQPEDQTKVKLTGDPNTTRSYEGTVNPVDPTWLKTYGGGVDPEMFEVAVESKEDETTAAVVAGANKNEESGEKLIVKWTNQTGKAAPWWYIEYRRVGTYLVKVPLRIQLEQPTGTAPITTLFVDPATQDPNGGKSLDATAFIRLTSGSTEQVFNVAANYPGNKPKELKINAAEGDSLTPATNFLAGSWVEEVERENYVLWEKFIPGNKFEETLQLEKSIRAEDVGSTTGNGKLYVVVKDGWTGVWNRRTAFVKVAE